MTARNNDQIFAEAMAWPYPPNNISGEDFPVEFQLVLDAFAGDLLKARRKIVESLANFTKAELIESLADASCAAIAHHAMLKTGHAVGNSFLSQVNATVEARRKGGKNKAANSGMDAKRRAAVEAWAKTAKRGRGTKTAFITRQASRLEVSPRTIERWIA